MYHTRDENDRLCPHKLTERQTAPVKDTATIGRILACLPGLIRNRNPYHFIITDAVSGHHCHVWSANGALGGWGRTALTGEFSLNRSRDAVGVLLLSFVAYLRVFAYWESLLHKWAKYISRFSVGGK